MFRSADGAFNAALLLERGDPLAAFVDAAGPFSLLPRGPPPPRPLPPPRFASKTGTKNQNDVDHVLSSSSSMSDGDDDSNDVHEDKQVVGNGEEAQKNNGKSCSTSQERKKSRQVLTGDNSNAGDHSGRRTDEKRRRREILGRRSRCSADIPYSSSLPFFGDREAALRMFELAESLGHPSAKGEIHRLRLRRSMDNLVDGNLSAAGANRQQGASSVARAAE